MRFTCQHQMTLTHFFWRRFRSRNPYLSTNLRMRRNCYPLLVTRCQGVVYNPHQTLPLHKCIRTVCQWRHLQVTVSDYKFPQYNRSPRWNHHSRPYRQSPLRKLWGHRLRNLEWFFVFISWTSSIFRPIHDVLKSGLLSTTRFLCKISWR